MSKRVIVTGRREANTHNFAINCPISIVCAEHILCIENSTSIRRIRVQEVQ